MFCNVAYIENLTQEKYDQDTTPNLTEVENYIEIIDNEIRGVLESAGIVIADLPANSLKILEKYCGYGSAGLVENSQNKRDENYKDSKGVYYTALYEKWIEKLRDENTDIYRQLGISSAITGGEVLTSNAVTDGYISSCSVTEKWYREIKR